MILLDTDHVSLLQWGGEAASRILAQLMAQGVTSRPATTIITYEEQIRGWMDRLAKSRTVHDEIRQYAKLSAHVQFYATIDTIEFSTAAAVEFQRLRQLKLRMGTMDLKIAAITLANNATLFTRNIVDFARVPGLQIADATR